MANSSPPMQATVSVKRTASARWIATARQHVVAGLVTERVVTCLNPSMSTSTSDSDRPCRWARSTSSTSRSWNTRWFTRPVSRSSQRLPQLRRGPVDGGIDGDGADAYGRPGLVERPVVRDARATLPKGEWHARAKHARQQHHGMTTVDSVQFRQRPPDRVVRAESCLGPVVDRNEPEVGTEKPDAHLRAFRGRICAKR
jgi:hypothetical protein